MRKLALSAALFLVAASPTFAQGLLIPADKSIRPLAMVYHRVSATIEDQVAVTTVEQAFRNQTDRQLEATYIFPVPRGAGVNRFTMLVDGKEMSGELVDAGKARQIYTDIVRRTKDPGLLEYLGNNLLQLRVFPIAPKSDQRITLRYTAVAQQDAGIVEYIYPLKTDGKSTQTLQDFSVKLAIRTQKPLSNIYSPTHAISIKRTGDRAAEVTFDRNQAILDKDFQLFYSVGGGEVGLTPLMYRPISSEDGYFLFLINPPSESTSARIVPRDVVFVLDTSGSMAGIKMDQAKKALRHCLAATNPQDRFAVLNFSTSVGLYRDRLVDASKEQIENAQRWVDNLRVSGGTAIEDALSQAVSFRSDEPGRSFTIVFFTDGQPTVGELNPANILKHFGAKNTANTRVFTFGVGDDVNATLLDSLAEQSRGESTYVRPAEDIEIKAASLYAKVSHPVLANLKLATGDNVRLAEVYPPQLPDLFAGSQLIVAGRYSGHGPAAIRLTGMMGTEQREFVFEVNLPAKGGEDREFVEQIWGRRKVGYLLDQIRANGEKKELVDEVVLIAKKLGIATPYTSYLTVPDSAMPVAGGGGGRMPPAGRPVPAILDRGNSKPQSVADFAKESGANQLEKTRDQLEENRLKSGEGGESERKVLAEAASKKDAFDEAKRALTLRRGLDVQAGRLGVDLSVESNNLRNQARVAPTAIRNVAGRNCLEIGGVWIDGAFDASLATVSVKAQSPAYFRLLERQPQMKEVFRLGNFLVWITPNKKALIVDGNGGQEEMSDADIDALFQVKK